MLRTRSLFGNIICNRAHLRPSTSKLTNSSSSFLTVNATSSIPSIITVNSRSINTLKQQFKQIPIIKIENVKSSSLGPSKVKKQLGNFGLFKFSTVSNNPEISIEQQVGSLSPSSRRPIGIWLMICAGMCFIMVILGGVTRLTESGLSIVEWKPIRGTLPPLSEEEWNQEFEKYKQSPEYQKLNQGMNVSEFKKIFFMEWAHRFWGRTIGLAFALPMAYFMAKGKIKGKSDYIKFIGLLGMGGLQGAIGWIMVKSGLDHKSFQDENSVPRVSAYRLAAHLTAAIGLYGTLFYMSLNRLYPARLVQNIISSESVGKLARLKGFVHMNTGLIGLTAFAGAFVAGLDAGLIYNTWPLMGEQVIPPGLYPLKPFYRNFFEHDATVQFNHRRLGELTWTASAIIWAYTVRNRKDFHPAVNRGVHALFGFATLQAALGITTLLTFVPVPLAASHQAGAVTLITVSLALMHTLKRASQPKSIAKIIMK